MRKFKVGDKVRILNNNDGHGFDIGEIVEVIEDGNQDSLICKSKENGRDYYLCYMNIDLVNQTPTLDNDTMVEKLDEYCCERSCDDCVFRGEDDDFVNMSDDELLSAYNLAFGNDQSNLVNNSESTPKYDLKKDKIAVLCDTDKKLTELYKLFNSKPNTSVALVINPSKLYISWDNDGDKLTYDSMDWHRLNHYTLLTFDEFMNGTLTESSTTFTITTSDTITTLTDGTHITSINRYYTDEHDDMVALEEVVKKYKSEIDEINKDKEIKEAIDKFIKDNNYDVEVEVKRKVVK